MPRYEARNTSNSARVTFESETPADVMEFAPAGTHRVRVMSDENATDIVIPTLTSVIDQAALNVGQTATRTTNGPDNVTNQWTLDGVDIPGATSASFQTTATGALRCRVAIPNNPQPAVTSDPVTVATAVGRPLLIGTGQSLRSAAASPVTFQANTSLAQTGDRLIMLLSHTTSRNANLALPAITDINGLSPGAALFDEFGALFPAQDGNHRRVIGYEYVMPSAGNSSFPITVDTLGAATILTIWTVRGGAYAGRAWASMTNATSAVNTITPGVAENILLTSIHTWQDPGVISWTNTTGQHSENRAAGASNNTIGAVAHQIDASWPNAADGHMITLSVEAV